MRRPTLREAGRWASGTLAAALALAGLARLTAAPVPYHPGSDGRLRLSWSARPERIEVCRELSHEELEELEEHMRQRVECEGYFASYDLRVTVDGREVVASTVRGGGFRHDRSIYLLREVELPSGERHVHVSFTRREKAVSETERHAEEHSEAADTGIYAGRAAREEVERSRRARAAVPATLVLDSTISVGPRQVVVITFDHERHALQVLDGDRRVTNVRR